MDELLGELPRDLFSDRLFDSCELVERYVSDLAVDAARTLRIDEALTEAGTTAEVAERLSLTGEELPALDWLLRRLAESGELTRDPDDGRYRRDRPLRESDTADLRALGLASDESIRPTLAILEAAAEALPGVLRGATTGEQALFSGTRMQLWIDYFHNGNPIYALNNRIAAIALANRLRSGHNLRLLEAGAGAGSGAEALLDELARRDRLGDIIEYRLTEPNPLLRRRAVRAIGARFPGLPLVDQAFDVDIEAGHQGVEPGKYDAVLAVNVLHIAKDLRAALETAHSLLHPGGWLVAGECLRLLPGQTIAIEMVFEQLRSFTRVELDPEVRPAHGFLSPEDWRAALVASGFADVTVVPDLERIRDHYERFFTGAICGRRRH